MTNKKKAIVKYLKSSLGHFPYNFEGAHECPSVVKSARCQASISYHETRITASQLYAATHQSISLQAHMISVVKTSEEFNKR